MENERIQISPLARAYLAAVHAGQVTEDSPERQLMDAAAYILRYGVGGCTADVLRVVAALCEAVAELKEEEEVLCQKKVLSSTDFQKTV